MNAINVLQYGAPVKKIYSQYGTPLINEGGEQSLNFYFLNPMWCRSDQWAGFYPSDKDKITKSKVKVIREGWVWLDGSDVTWSVWRGGEPTRNEGCARLHENKELVGKTCSEKYHYICKQVIECFIIKIHSMYYFLCCIDLNQFIYISF